MSIIKITSFKFLEIMKTVSKINVNRSFYVKVNQDIENLNQLIEEYNGLKNPKERIEKLKNILAYYQSITDKYTQNQINQHPYFSLHIHHEAFNLIQDEFKKHKIRNLQDALDETVGSNNEFSKILTNMPPKNVEKLLKSLFAKNFNEKEFMKIFDPNKDPDFENFLRNNSIQFLGGYNSKNYLITPNNGGTAYILKVENSFGGNKLAAKKLKKDALSTTIAPIMAERQSTTKIAGKTVTRSIVTLPFYQSCDLQLYSENIDDEKRITAAINIYQQMTDILIKINNAGCAFPDMKNSNWLMNENNQLILADTKSLIFSNNGFLYPENYPEIILTGFMLFPEVQNLTNVNAMHAFMLGKNLYHFLTKCDYQKLFDANTYGEIALDFNLPIFKTPDGQQLKKIIKTLMQPVPGNRPQLTKINEELKELKEKIALKATITEKMNELKNTVGFQALYNNIQQKIKADAIKTTDDLSALKQKIDNIETLTKYFKNNKPNFYFEKLTFNNKKDQQITNFLSSLKSKYQYATIKDMVELIEEDKMLEKAIENTKLVFQFIQKLRDNAGVFTVGMNQKANAIEKALFSLSPKERVEITDLRSQNKNVQNLHKIIAAHRHPFKSVEKNKKGEIIEHSAAHSYQEFKKQVLKLKNQDETYNNEPDSSGLKK